jgi:uncharacterized membrane protein
MKEHEHTETPHRRRAGLAEQQSHHTGEQSNQNVGINIDNHAHALGYHLHTSAGDDEMDDRDGVNGLSLTSAAANSSHQQADTHTRSLVKGFTWRIIATTTTTVIAWLVTGQLEAAFRIGIFEFFTKLLIYYIHERIWTRIRL